MTAEDLERAYVMSSVFKSSDFCAMDVSLIKLGSFVGHLYLLTICWCESFVRSLNDLGIRLINLGVNDTHEYAYLKFHLYNICLQIPNKYFKSEKLFAEFHSRKISGFHYHRFLFQQSARFLWQKSGEKAMRCTRQYFFTSLLLF